MGCLGLNLSGLTGITCLCPWVNVQTECSGPKCKLISMSNDMLFTFLFALEVKICIRQSVFHVSPKNNDSLSFRHYMIELKKTLATFLSKQKYSTTVKPVVTQLRKFSCSLG